MPANVINPEKALRVMTLAERSHRELLRGLEAAHASGDSPAILGARRRVLAHFDLVAQVRDVARVEAVTQRDRYHAVRSDLVHMTEARDTLVRECRRYADMLRYLERRLKANGRAVWRAIGFGNQNSLYEAILERSPEAFQDE